MKLLALLPFLAATAFASTDSASSDTPASSPPAEDPTPAGALWTASWNDSTLSPYTKSCATKSTYKAAIYTLKQLYPDLETFAPQLKVFYNKQLYPGSWEGVDKHGNDRELLKMDMADLPWKVREWIKRESTQRHYSVHDDIVFFAPGAIYPILPLWVEGGDEVGCSGVFDGLDAYANEPADGKTIGKVSHKQSGKGEVEFTVEALQVKLTAGGERSEL
ncbi:hypothetical protein N0V87_009432 [Didymella glomerata]|uniref:Uncharacterized protein n=1 Tax=Didymella glomerata TaxID=749621 RepID=A0A9W8WR48_9PLEO|nr:hypothetical protein N0V87_009432 [Didymella glomerata]